MKTHYSWSLKGNKTEIKNSFFVGSVILILGILSNGSSIRIIANNTINSLKFITFMKTLKKLLNMNRNIRFEEILLIMNNWSIHKSKSTIKYLKKIKKNSSCLYSNIDSIKDVVWNIKVKIKIIMNKYKS